MLLCLFLTFGLLNATQALQDRKLISESQIIPEEQNPVLYLHGFGGSKNHFDYITELLIEDGINENKLFSFNFGDTCGLEKIKESAGHVKTWVDNILDTTGSEKIDLISHSQGGVISRYYVKFLGGIDLVDDFVGLGVPNYYNLQPWGCNPSLDTLEEKKNFQIELNNGDESPGGILNDTIGPREDTKAPIIYNGTHIPGLINYTSIYSDDDITSTIADPRLDGANNIYIAGVSHSSLYRNLQVYSLVKQAILDENVNPNTSNGTTTQESEITSGFNLMLFVGIFSLLATIRKKK